MRIILVLFIDNKRHYLLISILLTLTIEILIDYSVVTIIHRSSRSNDLFCYMYRRTNEQIKKREKKTTGDEPKNITTNQ